MDPWTFLSTLLAIVVIDIVLAGDNAIVIALATRRLPADLQRRAIVWGTVGAIAVRGALTTVVVWLLAIPGLMLAGGLLLVWIAWKLLQPESGGSHQAQAAGSTTFWHAMRTVIVADAAMGLDNVLAVAGAAHGSYLLVVLGLAISVPLVVWGSTLVLRLVDRFPVVVYLGAGVLVVTAVKMIAGEPLLRASLQGSALGWLLYAAVPLLLVGAFLRNHRQLDSRIHARLAEYARVLAQRQSEVSRSSTHHAGEREMLKVLVPIDGSDNGLNALRYAVSEYRRDHGLHLHLLNVQPGLSRHVARFVARQDRQAWHAEQAEAVLRPAREWLQRAGVPHDAEWHIGERADVICRTAQQLGCHHIVMGTARKNSLTRMLEDSVTNQVLEHTPVPVEVVAGAAVSRLERWGIPAGFGVGVGALAWLVLD